MLMSRVGVVVIGGGPAGLAAAIAASVDGASVLLVDRDSRLGGTLKQAVHDGFGTIRFDKRLAGPEYAFADISRLDQTNAFVLLQTTVSDILNIGNAFQLTLCNRHGIVVVETKSIVLATGCLENSVKQMAIHGTRPAGVMTAGSAQYFINVLGQLPGKNCVILGSTNLGLIMARRLTLEGAKVLGVYEPKQSPDGLLQNITECLNDFSIPLHCEHTVTHIAGTSRLKTAVIHRVDKNLNPIRGTEIRVPCDCLIISTGMTPDTDLANALGVPLSSITQGPICDQNFMTLVGGVFCCGNAAHINSNVDYISESGEIAGRSAARYMTLDRQLVDINISKDFLYTVPQHLDIDMVRGDLVIYFRPREIRENTVIKLFINGQEVHSQEFLTLRPSEVERISININSTLTHDSRIELRMESNR